MTGAVLRKRTQARMLALQALCGLEGVGDDFLPRVGDFLKDEATYAELGFSEPLSDDLLRFAREMAAGAWGERRRLDGLLRDAAAHWSVERMTPVDRNVLRLALHELDHHPETPANVVFDEAIELARSFGDADSPKFVNGLLDAIWRRIERERAAPPPPATE